ncbi:MAG: DUF5329 domain-containing protein [Burkholderiales bacterium]
MVVALGVAIVPTARAEPPAAVRQEIAYLLRHVAESGCEFKRNGTWSDAKAAEAHVRLKYDYLLRWSRIDTTQDFIDKAATGSSLSGQPYLVKCADNLTLASSVWLRKALGRYRAGRKE